MSDLRLVGRFFLSTLGGRGRLLLMASVGITFLSGALFSSSPLFLARLADLVTSGAAATSIGTVILLSVIYLLAIATQRAAATVSLFLDSTLRIEGLKQVSRVYFDFVSMQDQAFFSQNNAGSIGSRLNQINNEFYQIVRSLVADVIGPLTQLIVAIIVLLVSGQYLVAAFFVAYCVAFVANHSFFARALVRKKLAMMDAGRRSYSVLIDSVANIEIAKQFDTKDFLASRYEDELNRDEIVQRDFWKMNLAMLGVSSLLYIALFAASFVYAVLAAASGRISVGEFVLVASFVLMLTGPIESLGDMFSRLTQSVAAFADFLRSVERPAKNSAPSLSRKDGSAILLERLKFRYSGEDSDLIQGVELAIRQGEKVSITGGSGAGKSTLLKLMAGQLQPSSGEVYLSGRDINDLGSKELSSQLSVLGQEALVFMDTLRFNLEIANPRANDEQLDTAVRAAQLHDFLHTLPKGLETEIGDRGSTVSGGQKQRIAFARVFLTQRDIILLDEATSALDVDTEEKILGALFAIFPGSTIVSVSHRASAIKLFDRAILMSEGGIVADGSPSRLIEENDFFRRIMQHSETERSEV